MPTAAPTPDTPTAAFWHAPALLEATAALLPRSRRRVPCLSCMLRRMQLKHGSYEVNPPFVPALLTAAAQRVLALLQVIGVVIGRFVARGAGWL